MLDYLPAILSLVGGLLAFFFAKSGERNQVGGVGWIMATFLVGGGLLGMYVLYDKSLATAEAKLIAEQEADKAAVAAAKQSALVMTLIGDFDLRQTIPSANFLFEYPYDEQGNPAGAVPGFVGPFPLLPKGVVGRLDVSVGDGTLQATFERLTDDSILLKTGDGSAEYVLKKGSIDRRGKAPEEERPGWFAQPEPAPGGFVYGAEIVVGTQLRRVLYNLVARESIGLIYFPRGKLDEQQLERIKDGFTANPPILAFLIRKTRSTEQCDSYNHVPLRIVRSEEPLDIDGTSFDVLDIQLTSRGMVPDPCNNDPF